MATVPESKKKIILIINQYSLRLYAKIGTGKAVRLLW